MNIMRPPPKVDVDHTVGESSGRQDHPRIHPGIQLALNTCLLDSYRGAPVSELEAV